MSLKKIYIILIRVCLILSVIFFSKPVYAKEIEKEAEADTRMIQQLIDAAAAGEVCLIPAGVYTVSGLCVTRPITLNGGGNVTLKYSSGKESDTRLEQSHIFAVWSDSAVIDGFIFENTGTSVNTSIVHYNGDNLEIRNNIFRIGQNSSGIISHAAAKNFVIDGNVFYTDSGPRSFPMIQLGNKSGVVHIKNNTLESGFPDILSSDFLSGFLAIESQDAVVSGNEFLYTGPLNNEDLFGYEDPDMPVTREVFAEFTKSHIEENNPWKRSLGDKANPKTKDGFCIKVIWIMGVIQLTAGLTYLIMRRRTG